MNAARARGAGARRGRRHPGGVPDEDLFAAVEGGGPALLRVDVCHVIYLTGQESGLLDAESYLASAPDPLLPLAECIVRRVNESHSRQLREAAERLTGEPAQEM
ncbi:hypothetical protein [Microbispora bryophytorum]|uniref:hypothetical protein n=1 Tax=Microbispora bryophytorum TaxID=1460882 RepID=UPI001CC2A376|nr:hypothetical protein [Microbispora camponoti]